MIRTFFVVVLKLSCHNVAWSNLLGCWLTLHAVSPTTKKGVEKKLYTRRHENDMISTSLGEVWVLLQADVACYRP